MAKKMLIDATHEEETRVAVVDGNRLDEFDYESKYRKALKGSIFLAKVTRVEPSLQAAFVNFGGNRHGFLPFSEIHPDYFRIPIADREALIAEQEAAMAEDEDDEDEEAEAQAQESSAGAGEAGTIESVEDEKDVIEEIGGNTDGVASTPAGPAEVGRSEQSGPEETEDEINGNIIPESEDAEDDAKGNTDPAERQNNDRHGGRHRHQRGGRGGRGRYNKSSQHRSRRSEKYDDEEQSGSDRFRFSLRRKYKIQEVIKRGQIMLVQVSKEERGNKGAAVSSYLSLPGRYCVLMPNSPRGGGVSRKIANYQDRAKMKDILKDMEVPKGMSVIVRTAGVSRTKPEVKRDLDYLMRLWDNIRELTLQSSAPALVYEEANLIKRAVRDLYGRDVDEIYVSGEEGYKQARDFMKMMIPSHVKKVIQYKDDVPLFNRFKVEGQIAEIGETQVRLPAGGYLVINPTEALISIDVNSGKATKERHIEETALRTNMEAAEEVARQLRLRDLGGLIVIDFIDMEDRRNNGKVERKMRESLSRDRARIQMGRISSFGLMELSRQRMNPSLTESQYETCKVCAGLGRVRTADATSIMVLRAIEDEGIKGRAAQVIVHVSNAVAVYILNYKRKNIVALEQRYNFTIMLRVDDAVGVSGYRVEVSKPLSSAGENAPAEDEADGDGDDGGGAGTGTGSEEDSGDRNNNKGGRRRGRRGGRRRNRPPGAEGGGPRENQSLADALDDDYEDSGEDSGAEAAEEKELAEAENKPHERGHHHRSGGRGGRGRGDNRGRHNQERPVQSQRQNFDNRAQEQAMSAPSAPESAPRQEPAAAEDSPASNDDRPARAGKKKPEPKSSHNYETVVAPSGEKKKGWWNRIGGD